MQIEETPEDCELVLDAPVLPSSVLDGDDSTARSEPVPPVTDNKEDSAQEDWYVLFYSEVAHDLTFFNLVIQR